MKPSASVLPEILEARIADLGERLSAGQPDRRQLAAVLDGLGQLPPSFVVRSEPQIARLGGLYRRHWLSASPAIYIQPRAIEFHLLDATPDLGWLLLFHRDGYVRQAALECLHEPPSSPFFFVAIAYRLNDWVRQVRIAARACAERLYPTTPSNIAAAAGLYLLDRRHNWLRWRSEVEVLDELFRREDVAAAMSRCIQDEAVGAMATRLRHALRYPSMDRHLLGLARDAVQPAVRAVARQALIDGAATWPTGFAREWVDKSLGQSRRMATFARRAVERPLPPDQLVREGLADRSVVVRRIAADGLIAHSASFPDLREIAGKLGVDRSPAIRERADFVLRKLISDGGP